MSFDIYSGGMDDYGDIIIKFDAYKLFDQGAIELDYEDLGFLGEIS